MTRVSLFVFILIILILAAQTLLFGRTVPRADDYVSLRQASLAEYQMGHYARAQELIRKALDLGVTNNNEYELTLSYSALGDILQAQRQFADAEQDYRNAISLLKHHPERSQAAATVWRNLAGTLTAEGRYGEAEAAAKEALRLVTKHKVEDPCLNAQILNSLGVIYYHQRKMAKAESSFLQAAELQFTASNLLDVDLWQIVNNLGRVYQTTRQYAKAEDAYRRSLQHAEVRRGRSHPGLSIVLDNLGSLYAATGRYQEAESDFRRSLAILEHSRTSFDAIFMMRTLYGLGEIYLRENDAIRAEGILARAAEIAHRRVLAVEMPEVLEVLDTYAEVLKEMSNLEEAQRLQREAQRIRASMAYTVPVGNAK
jgi:tetratricopeptide (TPR) repeat protein